MRQHYNNLTISFFTLLFFFGITGVVYGQALSLPHVRGPVPDTAASHAFLAAEHQQEPIDLADFGYVEEEHLISGEAGVYEWPDKEGLKTIARGPYVTRILIRRPVDEDFFSGTVIVEAFNPSTPVDLPIMWGESYLQFMADGVAWVGVTIKPNTIKSLKRFDPNRYSLLKMPHPESEPVCNVASINSWSQPTTPADETGLAWDILTQLGLLLKTDTPANPLGRPAQRLYMTGQSQTAGYARTYATVFARAVAETWGRPLYDGYLYSGSPPWQVPLHQCMQSFDTGDPRLLTGPAGVPVIELFAQGDIGTNIDTRRPDSDTFPDLYRRYEVAGAAHMDPWETKSFASGADMQRATGAPAEMGSLECEPSNVEDSDFPARYLINAAWRNLEAWVRDNRPAPRAPRLTLKAEAREAFDPATSFIVDKHGNAMGGVRSPYVDVPTARWIGAKTSSFQCMFYGYKYSFDKSKLKLLYGNHATYVTKVRKSVDELQRQGWLTREDAKEIIQSAEQASVP